MADQLDEIRNKIDIVELISEYFPLKKTGRNFKALCPFHSETAPSFVVSPERQIFKCFGCGAGGDIFGFLMQMEGMEFNEALRILAKRAGVKLKTYRPSEGERKKQLLYEINHLASEFYHYLLLNHPSGKKALDYILGRGITRESIDLFKLGFAPDLWESLQKFLVGKKGYRATDLEKAGLVIKSTRGQGFYDRFRRRLMFPLKDHRGNVVGFAGRVLESKVEEAKYINTPETLVYHKSELLYGLSETRAVIKRVDEAILVEGELDMISSYQAGVKNTLAIKGSALTESQIKLLSRFTKNIIFALDQDAAGEAATKTAVETAETAGLNIKVIQIKGGKDPDEVAQKNPKLWRKLVEKPVPVYDYFLNSALNRFDAQTAEGKQKIGQELMPILAKINDEIVKAHYLRQLAEKLAVTEEVVLAQMKKMADSDDRFLTKSRPVVEPVLDSKKKSQAEILEEHLLALAFQAKKWELLRKREVLSLVKTARFVRILEILAQYLKRFKTQESDRLAKKLPAELKETFNQLYFFDLSEVIEDEEKFNQEWAKAIKRLKKLGLKERLTKIAEEVKILEAKKNPKANEKKRLKKLDSELKKISQQVAKLEKEK